MSRRAMAEELTSARGQPGSGNRAGGLHSRPCADRHIPICPGRLGRVRGLRSGSGWGRRPRSRLPGRPRHGPPLPAGDRRPGGRRRHHGVAPGRPVRRRQRAEDEDPPHEHRLGRAGGLEPPRRPAGARPGLGPRHRRPRQSRGAAGRRWSRCRSRRSLWHRSASSPAGQVKSPGPLRVGLLLLGSRSVRRPQPVPSAPRRSRRAHASIVVPLAEVASREDLLRRRAPVGRSAPASTLRRVVRVPGPLEHAVLARADRAR